MFKWVKKLFSTPDAEFVEQSQTTQVNVPYAPTPAAAKTSKKPAAKKVATTAAKYNKAKLSKLTKVAIDNLAKDELGVSLDRRKTKDDLIKDFLAAQKAKK